MPVRSAALCGRRRPNTSDSGGRSEPLCSGYRSLLRLEGSETDYAVEIEIDPATSKSGLAPGTSGAGRISFLAVAKLPSLFAGQRFELREGTRVVGAGTIIDPNIE
jgi:hypothetical protein